MPDGDMAGQAAQGDLVEDLGHQAELLVDHDALAVADRDARGFLAPVLQRVQPVIGELCDFLAAGEGPENTAGILRAGIVVHFRVWV